MQLVAGVQMVVIRGVEGLHSAVADAHSVPTPAAAAAGTPAARPQKRLYQG